MDCIDDEVGRLAVKDEWCNQSRLAAAVQVAHENGFQVVVGPVELASDPVHGHSAHLSDINVHNHLLMQPLGRGRNTFTTSSSCQYYG